MTIAIVAIAVISNQAWAQSRASLAMRGQTQWLHLYGPRAGPPVVVSSGDGGWIHLAPHVAEFLAAKGFFVVGFDVKAYLEGFTSGTSVLRTDDEPHDFKVLADFASAASHKKPILIGVSEGAGLSVLAAGDPRMKTAIAGVIGLGLSDMNELGWRWKDAVIYFTHGNPNEPSFSVSAIVDRMTPVPLGAIHSTHDEYVPLAEVQGLMARAKEPKKLWIVDASNHRFSDNLSELDRRLLEAVGWINEAEH